MREIKFRAFHTPTKVMFWFDPLWGNNGHGNGWVGMAPFGEEMTRVIHRDNLINVDPTDCEIMQFTGLYDKNGKEIYEGDILLHTGTNQCDLEVHFKEGAFWGKGMFTDCVMDMFLKAYDFHSIEVISNIYESKP